MTPLDRRMRATILVVDDEEMSRDLIARILRERGCVVHTAPNTEDAYAELASGQIDLMLCDVMMPDETGTEFLARLRLDYPDLAVVMVSGIANTHIAQLALELGAYGYVTKPFSASQLIVTVANAVQRHELERQNRLYRNRLDAASAERLRDLSGTLDQMQAGRSSSDIEFRTLFEAVPGRYLVLDAGWQIVAATDAYLEATLTVRDTIVGRYLFDVFPDNPADRSSESGRSMRASLEYVVTSGTADVMPLSRHDVRVPGDEERFEERYWSPTNTPVFAADGLLRYIVHSVENVTELFKISEDAERGGAPAADVPLERMLSEIVERRTEVAAASRHLKETNAALEAQLEQARRLESLGQLAGGVAHDFNNLLGVILNYAAFVGEAITAAAQGPDAARWEGVQRDVQQIELASERAVSLTRQLLMFARREVVQPQIVNVNAVVSDVEQLLRRTIGEDIELHTTLEAELWTVSVDPGQLQQLLMNLAVNARDAMSNGGTLSIDTRNETVDAEYAAWHPELAPGSYVRLRVSDTGTGMAPAIVERAFDPFFTTKPVGEGSGLGLATAHGIVAQAGGHVHIYSEVGIGTTITALLPVTNGTAMDLRSGPDVAVVGGNEMVLVVEDEDAIREITRRILARNGYRVLTAASGAEGLAIATQYGHDIDLLLTDVIMPQMPGKELAEKMRADRPDLHVLYMSGYAQPMLASRGTLDEGVELIEKPFSAPTLLARVRAVLDC